MRKIIAAVVVASLLLPAQAFGAKQKKKRIKRILPSTNAVLRLGSYNRSLNTTAIPSLEKSPISKRPGSNESTQ